MKQAVTLMIVVFALSNCFSGNSDSGEYEKFLLGLAVGQTSQVVIKNNYQGMSGTDVSGLTCAFEVSISGQQFPLIYPGMSSAPLGRAYKKLVLISS